MNPVSGDAWSVSDPAPAKDVEMKDDRDRDHQPDRDSRGSRDRYPIGSGGRDYSRDRDRSSIDGDRRELSSRDSDRRYSERRDGDRRDGDRRRHSRDRDGRDRDGGGGRSRRERDRNERDEYRRDRDRERERAHRTRPRDGRDLRDDRYDNRRRDGRDNGGGRSDRYNDRPRTSRRSRSPDHRRSGRRQRGGPQEDLSGVISIDKRVRMKSLWDVKPPGYENVTTEMAKLSGLFPLAGAPRPIDYGKLQGLVPNLPGSETAQNGQGGTGPASLLRLEASRAAKRLIVSGFETGSHSAAEIAAFFNEQLKNLELDVALTGNVVSQSFSNESSNVAVLEFENHEVTTIALAYDGGFFLDDDTKFVMQIQRPKDYITPTPSNSDITAADVTKDESSPAYKTKVPDSSAKISVAGIPSYLNEEQIVEVLQAFGPLAAFQIIKDKFSKESCGIAFCEFKEKDATDMACQGLNGMELGNSKLRVKPASRGVEVQESALPFNISDSMASLGTTVEKNNRLRLEDSPVSNTSVLLLLNMVTFQDLLDEQEYKEIREDIEGECTKYGKVEKIIMQQPDPKAVSGRRLMIQVGPAKQSETKFVPGAGKVYIKFDSPDACRKAHNALGGRRFSDRTVISSYFPEENFNLGIF